MVNLDEALKILENKARREILERLVREPHYPLQLSHQIGVSQQAIMKHLRLLEKSGFVTSDLVPSEKGGPPRRIYAVTNSFSMRLDLGPDLFRVEKRNLPSGGPMRISNKLPPELLPIAERVSGRKKLPLGEAMTLLSKVGNSLDSLDNQRDALIALHQHIRSKVGQVVDSEFEIYEERQLMHNLLENPSHNLNLRELSKELQIGASDVEKVLDEVRDRLLRTLGEQNRNIIAGPQDTDLPWWMVLEQSRNK